MLNSFHNTQNEAVKKALDYFDACMNETEIERLDAAPLEKIIKDYGSWNVTDPKWNESSWDYMDVQVRMQKYLFIEPIFDMIVGVNRMNSTENVIQVSCSQREFSAKL